MAGTTLSDVAAAAGVSPMTVSRTLRGVGRVKAETRRRVREAADRLGYLRDEGVLAPARHRGSTEPGLRLLLVTRRDSTTEEELGQELLRGLADRLNPTGGVIERCDGTGLDEIMDSWENHHASGVVLRSHLPSAWVEALRRRGPVVQGASYDFHPGVDAVFCNELRTAGTVLQQLWHHGHQDILWLGLYDIGAPNDVPDELLDKNSIDDLRLASIHGPRYAAWAYLASTDPRQTLLIADRYWQRESVRAVLERQLASVLDRTDRPTAIVVPTDFMGVALLALLAARGIEVPHEMTVICYGGTLMARESRPKLTAVKLPMYTIGSTIPELIQRRLADPDAVPMTLQLEANLAPGETVANAQKGDSR